jgi:predicted protein tyrosine phosphatase
MRGDLQVRKWIGKFRRGVRLVWWRLRDQGLYVTVLWAWEHAVRIVTGAPRRSTSRIAPGVIVGGQYRRRGWPELKRAGVTGVVNMRIEFCDREAGIAPERYLRLPTVDDEAPSQEQLRRGVAFMQEEIARGGAVYVHCGAGMGRAATMAAAYLVSQGQTPDEAWAQIRAVRPFIRPTPPQIDAVRQWAAAQAAHVYRDGAEQDDPAHGMP